jgi:hypothetical protein
LGLCPLCARCWLSAVLGGAVGKVVNLERERTVRLASDIERVLRRSGERTFAVPSSSVEDPIRWRRAAVMAAHRLGFRACTYRRNGCLVVEVARPVTDAERRSAAEVFSGLLLAGPRRRC